MHKDKAMSCDKHADADGELCSTLRVIAKGQLDDWRDKTTQAHREGRECLLTILAQLDDSQHGRARRVFCERLLRAHDRFGPAVPNLASQVWARAQAARARTRFFVAAMAGEMAARKW